MSKNTPKLSTIVGEKFRITHVKLLKILLNYPPWLGKILELLIFTAKNTAKLSTMVGENFRITYLKWLKIHLNYPPWLEKSSELPILNGKKHT